MIKAFVPPLSSHAPLTASRMKQSELPPAVTVSPACPESRACNVQSNAQALNEGKNCIGNHVFVAKSSCHSFYCFHTEPIQRKYCRNHFYVGSNLHFDIEMWQTTIYKIVIKLYVVHAALSQIISKDLRYC